MRGGAEHQGNQDTGGTGTEEQPCGREKHTSCEVPLLRGDLLYKADKGTHVHVCPRETAKDTEVP